jgi:hypothetical protein
MSDTSYNDVVPNKSLDLEEGENDNDNLLSEETDKFDINSRSERDLEFIKSMRRDLLGQYEDVGIKDYTEAEKYMADEDNNDIDMRVLTTNHNTTLSFFNRRTVNEFVVKNHSEAVLRKWFNKMEIKNLTIWDKICFYTNSLYNNKVNKFKFVQYMGELTMMYEDSNKSILEIQKLAKEIMEDSETTRNKGPLYFLNELDDDINNIFQRIDVFLRRHIEFMMLCSAPADLFLDNYFAARSNCCGLIEVYHSMIRPMCPMQQKQYYTVFLDFKDCRDKSTKHGFLLEMEGSYLKGADRVYSTDKRVAALHNILGELHAISEFIKTSVEMNDQLLFRVLMLFGSFLTLLGEYVWNTQLKQYHYD